MDNQPERIDRFEEHEPARSAGDQSTPELGLHAELDRIVDGPAKKAAPPTEDASALGPPRHATMTIVAQDPTVTSAGYRVITSAVRVPADRLEPPLRSHRFTVVSYDPAAGGLGRPFDLINDGRYVDRFAKITKSDILASHDFHAQNVYAIAARTLAAFEAALGRRVPWSFGRHQLFLIPHAFEDANAHYSPDKQGILFGFLPASSTKSGQPLYTCLSHDIVAHETTHALLAGLRPEFMRPSLPDQRGFHEAFADIVALLSVFAVPAVVEHALGETHGGDHITAAQVSAAALRETVLFQLAEEVGEEVLGERRPLRHSVALRPGTWWHDDETYLEDHNRGEILVAAVARTMLRMWSQRLREITTAEGVSRRRAAEEGSKAAEHLLRMCIRAIDYTPPTEFEFADFLDAVITSDEQMAPDDNKEHDYRGSLRSAFAEYGITPPEQRIIPISSLKRKPRYERFNFASLRSDPDEVFRFIWENDELLEISLDFDTVVESVRPSTRVGPDGFVVNETVVTYLQRLDARAGELRDLSRQKKYRHSSAPRLFSIPAGVDPAAEVQIFGGGAIIFDQFGRPKFHQHKPLLDWKRQAARLRHFVRKGRADSKNRFGFTSHADLEEPFAAFHRPDVWSSERW